MSLINAERMQRGIPALTVDTGLSGIAARHSREMASQGRIWHAGWTQRASEPWTAYGENVGVGPDLDSVHKAFMDSPEHRRNILEPVFKLVGTGESWRDGTVYVTEIYVLRRAPRPRVYRAAPTRLRPKPRPKPRDFPVTVSMLLRLAEWA